MRCKPMLGAAIAATLIGSAYVAGAAPAALGLGGCTMFPADNVWNAPIDQLPIDPHSADYIQSIGADKPLHPDFGSGTWDGGPIGIPFKVVPESQPTVHVEFRYADESDPGPYPLPPDAPIEGGAQSTGDRHVLLVQEGTCRLYELFAAYPLADGSWRAGSGAIFDLRSNALIPDGFTSADAAGLPILPGLVRHEEVATGVIRHAIRFTVPRTRRDYVWPARHYASSSDDPSLPPMGQRFRLRADFDLTGFPQADQVILQALKTYGMILADNGSSWFIGGAPDPAWDNAALHLLTQVKGSDFVAVDTSSLMVDPNTGAARGHV